MTSCLRSKRSAALTIPNWSLEIVLELPEPSARRGTGTPPDSVELAGPSSAAPRDSLAISSGQADLPGIPPYSAIGGENPRLRQERWMFFPREAFLSSATNTRGRHRP